MPQPNQALLRSSASKLKLKINKIIFRNFLFVENLSHNLLNHFYSRIKMFAGGREWLKALFVPSIEKNFSLVGKGQEEFEIISNKSFIMAEKNLCGGICESNPPLCLANNPAKD